MDPNDKLPEDNQVPSDTSVFGPTEVPQTLSDQPTPVNNQVETPIATTQPPQMVQPTVSQPAPTVSPAPESPVVVSSNVGVPPPVTPPKNSKKKRLLVIAGAAVLVALLAGGYVFGFYLPNKPENVYSTGLERTGKAITSMVNEATEKDKLSEIEKSEINGNLEVNSKGETYKGNFSLKLDKTKSNGNFEYAYKADGVDKKISGDFMTKLADDALFPDVYFKINGIQELAGDYLPGLEAYDNKWIEVSSSYLSQLGSGFMADQPKNRDNVSAEDIAALVRTINDVTNEYVFTSDSSKSVLEKKSFVGKEKTSEGVNAYRYKVGINKEHAVAYCKALSDRVLSESAYKKMLDLDDEEISKQKQDANKSCDDTAKDVKADETFDMWIDSKYKVLHKLRFVEKDNPDQYTDVGQVYTGGDKIAMFMHYVNSKEKFDAKLTMDVNIKQTSTEGKLTVKNDSEQGFIGQFELEAGLSAKAYDGEVEFQPPAGAIPIDELLKQYGFDPTGASGVYQAPTSVQ